jgi:hypothetical protein
VICQYCKKDFDQLLHIRGKEACTKCHFEFIWDFVEGTRRMVEGQEKVVAMHRPIYTPEYHEKVPVEEYIYDFTDILDDKYKKGVLKEW